MFSVQGDIVLDPYPGTGTTTFAAIASARNSIGYEIDQNFKEILDARMNDIKDISNERNEQRIEKHKEFMKKRLEAREEKYRNKNYDFPVVTNQETNLIIPRLKEVRKIVDTLFEVDYF